MSQEVRAIYENGLFRPLGPVTIAEHDIVTLVVEPAIPQPDGIDDELKRQRKALAEMFEEADRLPLESLGDAFSGADHDLVLYGWKK